ncbi:2-amino-4-hydroxy-6-hydroxymethyldihydropteridine diphosphokinase [Parashewanella spongiae]|uniref:2-amino-4-hydroxy-6-hydroxymethyldihydropteridine pyrophosphokinase n=1 Tax=Parashewanella spongiae TaxID=342950 RepID=A0A3A6UDM5_9GAMM|nr:2-amino-4-hydroxy-6-hydroxymethyldihydropteridine diphosphokinase [Parashewanella spongiae]MCL1079991.1 2-amino-4-hydroxy-6-hydroxymethyldihydropteridine diphosphokinase [Parashewanella spongiae]RJY16879.1 2-amino-4-hydroxy-6-hydroxymethyldihydropteridine diphosphokinase [Parashewanella spongiae]
MATVFIALGANMDNPKQQLDNASLALETIADKLSYTISPYYRSVPMGDVMQPDYLNAVASFTTQLSPSELLGKLQEVEQQQGRQRLVRWGPRTLDLDILLYDNLKISTESLTIPHYGMKSRGFVLIPLLDIAPSLVLPCGTFVESLINEEMNKDLQRFDTDPCSAL